MFYQNILKAEQMWEGEKKILSAIVKHKKVAVASGNSCGKDWVAGGLPLWWLSAYYPAKCVITAPTERQVKSIIWMELERHFQKAGGEKVLGGRLKTQEWFIEEDRFCVAFTTKEVKGQKGKFQGFHSPSLLIIASEAQAVDDSIFEQIEGVATSENSRILLLGNPLHSTGYFARALQGTEYHSIHLSCLDTPNYIERKEVVPGLASYEWVENMREKYGEDSAIWQARVLGQLPKGQTIDAILDYYTARLAVGRDIYIPAGARRGISIDPAAFGDDEALIQVWEEKKLIHQESYPKTRTTQLSSRAIILAEKFDIDAFVIDTVAERGVFDEIYQAAGRKYQMFEFKGSFGAKDAEQYKNARAESYFVAQKEFENNAVSIPDDETLIEELCETKYFFTRDGKKQIEAKEEIKSRIGRSPNRADALTMWLWVLPEVKKKKKAVRDVYVQEEVTTSINPWVV